MKDTDLLPAAESGPASVADSPNPYLFVVGCQRSGTTLLQRMLDRHPELAVGYDSHFIPRALKGLPVGTDPVLTPELVEAVMAFPRFGRLGLPDEDVRDAAATSRTYSEFVAAIYTALGRLHGKPLGGEKSPGYCRHLPHLHALFPRTRVVHLIRDGRDVTLSVLDWGKGPTKLELFAEEPVATCALWWRRDLTVGRRDGAALEPGLYREIRYEDLVADAETQLQGLCDFLDLPYTGDMLAWETKDKPGLSSKAAWLAPTQGLRDWRSQMSDRDVEVFEAIAGDVLSELGYERAAPKISPEIAEVARRSFEWWNRFTMGRRKNRPAVSRRPARPRTESSNPFVFIVGCPRSGTTLLRRVVDAHPLIAIPRSETHWIPRLVKKQKGLTDADHVTPTLVRELLAYHKFDKLGLDPADVEALIGGDEPITYASFVSGILDLYGELRDKRLVGDKTPGYVQDIPVLHGLWPDARFVHLIRDGRDVCLSMLDWKRSSRTAGRFETWSEDPVTTTALWWERFTRLGCEAGRSLGPRLYCEVRYEQLVNDPERVCRDLCEFLGVPMDGSMTRFHEGRTRDDADLSAKKRWLPATAGLRDWRSQMSPDDLERFEAVSGGWLETLGYGRGCEPSADALARARVLRERFTADPRLRRRSLPNDW